MTRTTHRLSQLITPSVLFLAAALSHAQTPHEATLHGTVKDPLGAVVQGATISLIHDGEVLTTTQSDANGMYHLTVLTTGHYALRSTARTFVTTEVTIPDSAPTHLDITLATPTATEEVTVTATGTPTPLAQVAAPVTVLTREDFPYNQDIQEPLRYVPGVQITQTGQSGGTSGLYIRGGDTDANKVLIDGIPANDVGGAVEFANISTAGIARAEVLREPNSALYGSDALAGVVSLTTRRGTTPLPQLDYSAEGGNFGTYRQEAALGGAIRKLDYFSDFTRQDTGNSVASSAFHNATFADNIGYQPNDTTDLRFNFRHITTSGGQPNAILLYGIPDSANVSEQDRYLGAVLNSQTTSRWHNQLRYGSLRLNFLYSDYAPTGVPQIDPEFGGIDDYLGAPVTIRGANGYSVSGQAIFQYPGTYPSFSTNHTARDFMYAQTDYRLTSPSAQRFNLLAVGGFKYEDERGSTVSTGFDPNTTDRRNYSTMLELQGDFDHRAYFTIGTGLEKNAVFGFAATPRASLGYYLVRPGGSSLFSGTKLHASFSKGIKEPSIYQQANSLFGLLSTLPDGGSLISQNNISPAGAETSRTYDGGIDQELAGGKARVGLTYFHNEFGNGLEFLSQSALTSFGIPQAAVDGTQFGAYVNSLAFRAQGLETQVEIKLSNHLFARGGYTLLDAVVQRSFSSSALAPVFNTSSNFSNIAIGSYGPLVGARPFRRARNSAYFGLTYTQSRFSAALNGTLVGKRDDSTFLTDADFGNSLLLPNHNLIGSYQRLEATGSYQVARRLVAYTEIQNLLSEHYSEAFGYPALPFNFRSGIRVTLGGETWKLK
ncbi:TonB-dependent receptor [Granulicella sibirica]|uniref:Outer membrane vitamin B12 receptor BtuB n=1 Tax=Granulicella sibirica TaxID=2479048 RepID=A0A4Q0T4F4_9BACT|nr:TonB-dependent receptor plug domain-containing protein [Granulicella sibirica]RXH56918.1 Outer membrane vitamin B12 receptor BtuB [Granulicella sibirica]